MEKVTIIWTTADKEAALNMAFMYAKNAKVRGWWDEIDFVIWGPSDRLACEDADIQTEIATLLHVGVQVKACIACAERYGAVEKLRALGVEVLPMGLPLTETLKAGGRVLTI